MIGFTIVLGHKRKRPAKRKKRINFKIKKQYLIIFVLLLITVTVASFFVDKKEDKIKAEEVTAKSVNVFKEINGYSEYYIPVVMNDFTSYRRGDQISNDIIIKLGIWSILSTENKSEYETLNGKLYIPAKDLKERIGQLFADNMQIENKSIDDEKYSIIFDKNTECYVVPIIGFSPEFTPALESVAVKSNRAILTVGCLRGENYKQDSSGNTVAPEAEKRIIIKLKKEKDGYYIEEISEE